MQVIKFLAIREGYANPLIVVAQTIEHQPGVATATQGRAITQQQPVVKTPEPAEVEEPIIESQVLQATAVKDEPELASSSLDLRPAPQGLLQTSSSPVLGVYDTVTPATGPAEVKAEPEMINHVLEEGPCNIPLPQPNESKDKETSDNEQSSADKDYDARDTPAALSLALVTQEELEVHDNKEVDAAAVSLPENECLACWDQFPNTEVITLPCGHHMCRDCLQWRFTRAVKDESCFPPACCEPISLESALPLLPPEMEYQYRWKKVEFETVDRTYCSNAECSQFLSYSGMIKRRWEYCVDCKIKTCTMCKKGYHYGNSPKDCSEDVADLEVKHMGQEEGWQQCPKCKLMVQLVSGCFHIEFVFPLL